MNDCTKQQKIFEIKNCLAAARKSMGQMQNARLTAPIRRSGRREFPPNLA